MLGSGIAIWQSPLVVLYNMSVAGVRVVEFGTNLKLAEADERSLRAASS